MLLYTVVVKGKPEGPYSLNELRNLKISPGTFVKTASMDDYKEAHELAELRELFGFEFIKTSPQYFASFDQRLMAWAIDLFLIGLIFAVAVFVCFLFVLDTPTRIKLLVLGDIAILLTNFIYGVMADASSSQGTIGKRLMNIRVGNLFGEKLSMQQSFIRTIAKIFSIGTLGIGYLVMFTNKNNQCMHDKVADTLVVKDRLL